MPLVMGWFVRLAGHWWLIAKTPYHRADPPGPIPPRPETQKWRTCNKRHFVPSNDVHLVDHSFLKVFGPAEAEAVGASLAGRSSEPTLPRGGGCSPMAMLTRALLRSLAGMEAMRGNKACTTPIGNAGR